MIFDIDGLSINIIDSDDRMVAHMKDGSGYEHDSLVAWSRMVQPGRVALDIGAYTGLFSIIAAKRGALAVAFEPMPANKWRLDINARQNKVEVKVYALALSDCEGVAALHYNPRVPLTTGASLESGNTLHHDTIFVRRVALDTLNFRNVAAIKIDVERHEPCVILGAMRTIIQDRPTLLIETLDDDMRNEVLELLPQYTVAAILDGRNTMFTPQ